MMSRNSAIELVQLAGNGTRGSPGFGPDSLAALKKFGSRVKAEQAPIGQSSLLRKYHIQSSPDNPPSILALIKSKMSKPKADSRCWADMIVRSKENKQSFSNRLPSSEDTHLKHSPSSDKSQKMMSRIGWLFELRNLYDKLKRRSDGGCVQKDVFLNQLAKVTSVRLA